MIIWIVLAVGLIVLVAAGVLAIVSMNRSRSARDDWLGELDDIRRSALNFDDDDPLLGAGRAPEHDEPDTSAPPLAAAAPQVSPPPPPSPPPAQPDADAEPAPEPPSPAEPGADADADADAEPTPDAEVGPDPESSPDTGAEPTLDAEAEPEPASAPEADGGPTPGAEAESEPASDRESESDREPEPEAAPAREQEPEPESVPAPDAAPGPEAEPVPAREGAADEQHPSGRVASAPPTAAAVLPGLRPDAVHQLGERRFEEFHHDDIAITRVELGRATVARRETAFGGMILAIELQEGSVWHRPAPDATSQITLTVHTPAGWVSAHGANVLITSEPDGWCYTMCLAGACTVETASERATTRLEAGQVGRYRLDLAELQVAEAQAESIEGDELIQLHRGFDDSRWGTGA